MALILNERIFGNKYIQLVIILIILFLIGASVAVYKFYQSYKLTQQSILILSNQLADTRAELNLTNSFTTEQFTNAAERLADQESKINEKTEQLSKLEADIKKNQDTNFNSSNVSSELLSSLAKSVVKIVCTVNSTGKTSQGSGMLYYSASGNPSKYFIQSSLHIVKPTDTTPSSCVVSVYPDYKEPTKYRTYKTSGYITYKDNVDFAYLIPQLTNIENAGTMAELGKYAKTFNSNTYCKPANIGDNISILGYPLVGGSSLTATDGIISGFEFYRNAKYIKTSAKIERGNSGGVAIKNSGCILGIPTFIQAGTIESLGRVLDLYSLFNE